MSFLSAIPVIAPSCHATRSPFSAAGRRCREFSAGCALSAASAGALTVAAALQAPDRCNVRLMRVLPFPFFVLQGLRCSSHRRCGIALSVLAFTERRARLHHPRSAAMTVGRGPDCRCGRCRGSTFRPWSGRSRPRPSEKPAIGIVVVGSAAVVFHRLAHVLAHRRHVVPGPPGPPLRCCLISCSSPCGCCAFPSSSWRDPYDAGRIIAGLRAMIPHATGLTGALSRGTSWKRASGSSPSAWHARSRLPSCCSTSISSNRSTISTGTPAATWRSRILPKPSRLSSPDGASSDRIGGEEFGIVCRTTRTEQAKALAEDICRVVRRDACRPLASAHPFEP